MRRLRRYGAALARQQPIDVVRSRLDHHRPLQANKTVADLAVVMPRYALPGGKAQHLDAQIRALGDQLAACDRVSPRLRVCIIWFLRASPRHWRRFRGLSTILTPSWCPWQQAFTRERQVQTYHRRSETRWLPPRISETPLVLDADERRPVVCPNSTRPCT